MPSILLVDDDPATLHTLKSLLEKRPDSEVHCVQDAGTALQVVRENVPDLVITDIRMPGMDGFALIEALEESRISVPVIVISGDVDAQDAEKVRELGVKQFLPKPIGMDTLTEAVDLALGQSPADSRSDPRYPVTLCVQHVTEDGEKKVTYETETTNCSLGGICFKWYFPFGRLWSCDRMAEQGAEVSRISPVLDLTIFPRDDRSRKVRARAKIVHCVRAPDKEFDYIGAEFIDLDGENRRELDEILGPREEAH